jgi:hypothetical protein
MFTQLWLRLMAWLFGPADVPVARSAGTGPWLQAGPPRGGSVRAALQIAPDRDTLYREAGELAALGAFDAAADLVIAASTRTATDTRGET